MSTTHTATSIITLESKIQTILVHPIQITIIIMTERTGRAPEMLSSNRSRCSSGAARPRCCCSTRRIRCVVSRSPHAAPRCKSWPTSPLTRKRSPESQMFWKRRPNWHLLPPKNWWRPRLPKSMINKQDAVTTFLGPLEPPHQGRPRGDQLGVRSLATQRVHLVPPPQSLAAKCRANKPVRARHQDPHRRAHQSNEAPGNREPRGIDSSHARYWSEPFVTCLVR